MAGERDLKIVRNIVAGEEVYDLAFGADGEPLLLTESAAIAQDVGNRILDSGLAVDLVAIEGGSEASALTAIALEAEEDHRIRPGTAESEIQPDGRIVTTMRLMSGEAVTTDLTP